MHYIAPKIWTIQNCSITLLQVFHGIRFKVEKLFVVTTDNFFCTHPTQNTTAKVQLSLTICQKLRDRHKKTGVASLHPRPNFNLKLRVSPAIE